MTRRTWDEVDGFTARAYLIGLFGTQSEIGRLNYLVFFTPTQGLVDTGDYGRP